MTTSQGTERRESDGQHDGTRGVNSDAERDTVDIDDTTIDAVGSARTEDGDAVEPAAVRAAIHIHGERIKQRELQQALGKLNADGELSDTQRRIVEEMATAILDELLSTPDAVLAAADDPETLQTVVELFDPTE
jgi:glutamyl-tRNA reductase